jgi:hypothetical protein
VDAAHRASAPAPTEPDAASPDPAPAAPTAHRLATAAPARAVPATAGLRIAAARRVAPAVTRPQPPARPTAPIATPPKPAARASRGREPKRVTVVHLVCWQLAAVAVVLGVQQPLPVLAGASAGAVALVALTAVRIDGRWLYKHGALAAAYLCRTRRRTLPDGGGAATALLDLLVPGAAIRSTSDDRETAGTISHRGGVTAVLRTEGGDLPASGALLSLVDGQEGVVAIQAVCHAETGGPARVWLAVHAVRGVDTPADDELTLVLRNAVRRARRALKRAGVPVEPLTEEAASARIAALAHVPAGGTGVREGWRCWQAGGVRQATFRLRGWHRLADAQARRLTADLVTAAAGARPSVAVTVTVGARPGAAEPRVDAVLRLAGTTDAAVEAALAAVTVHAAGHGIDLVRLDGAHSRGVAASLPIGVFLT